MRPAEDSIKKTNNITFVSENRDKVTVGAKIADANKNLSLTVKHIIDEINDSAPFQRDAITQNYHGIRVNWEGKLWDIEKSLTGVTGDKVKVKLNPEPNSLYGILFEVSITKYPQLKIARRDSLIGVLGRIVACSGPGMYVRLDVDEITIHENTQA